MKTKITWAFILMAFAAMIIGLSSCSTTKKVSHSESSNYDSAGKSTSDNLTIINQSEQADTVVSTDSSSLEGSFDFWNAIDWDKVVDTSGRVYESDDISILVKPDKASNLIIFKATAKPKSIPVKVQKQTNTVSTNHTQNNVQTHKENQVKDREKVKTGIPFYWWILLAVAVLCFFVYRWYSAPIRKAKKVAEELQKHLS